MKPQRDINTALACAVFAWIFTFGLWKLGAGAHSFDSRRVFFGTSIVCGLALDGVAFTLQAAGLKTNPPDKDRGVARFVRISVLFHVLVALIGGAYMMGEG